VIPFLSIIRNADGSWVFTWPDHKAPFYRVVLLGRELAVVSVPTYTWSKGGSSNADYPPALEIVLPGQQALSEIFPSYFEIQWYQEALAHDYTVQSGLGDKAQTVQTVAEEGLSWVYTYRGPSLLDETTCSYQVIAENRYGDQAPPRGYTRYMVTLPASPDGTWELLYNKPNAILQPL